MKASLPRARAARLATRLLPNEDPEFQIAPMIDILLVLLVFFMSIATNQVLQKGDGLILPRVNLGQAPVVVASEAEIWVNLFWSPNGPTRMDVDGKGTMNLPALVAYAQKRQALPNGQGARFIIRADKRVTYQDVRPIMAAFGKAGVPHVTFSVADKNNPE